MPRYPLILVIAGAFACLVIAVGSTFAHGPALIDGLEHAAARAAADAGGQGITARFRTSTGWLTRHAVLSGGDGLPDSTRRRVAEAIAALPGVGGVRWAPRSGPRTALEESPALHCQDDVNGILKARTIRFAEASAAIDPASAALLDEVAAALRPCAGSLIAITGHTDASGDEAANRALSRQRAMAVRAALGGRGIALVDLRAAGKGSEEPLAGLDPADPANRRIEFSVIAKAPLLPTPVDTPGAG